MFFLPIPPIPDFVVLAYLDPGSGSLLIQMLLAALAGASLFLRVFWDKLKNLLPGSNKYDEDSDMGPEDAEESRA